MSEWKPVVGDWVVYRAAHPDASAEDGEVTEVVSAHMVRVLYRGDRNAKATYIADLTPGIEATDE